MNRYGAALLPAARSAAPGESRRPKASFDRLLSAAALAAFLATAVSFLARASWLFELVTHFRFQLALGSMVLLLCALARRRLLTAALAALAAAANAAPLVPYLLAGPAAAVAADPLRVMSANVHYRNFDYAALLEEVRREDPDVLGLMEVDQAWLDGLSALESEFHWTLLEPQEGPYGLALYSKLPFRPLSASPYVEDGFQTALAVELATGGQPVTLVLAHVLSPTTPGRAERRNVQFTQLAELLEADGNAAQVLVGDLNTAPWSPYFRQLASAAELRNAALGRGYQPTWPSGFSLLKIPIDHALVSDGLRVDNFRTGGDFGSDHLPIVIDLSVREEPISGAAAL